MLDLTGARLVPGTIDVGGPGPEPPVIRCATRAWRPARPGDPARAQRGDPALARVSRSPTPRTGSTCARPCSGATTSPARPTSSRRSRASTASSTSRPRCPATPPSATSAATPGCAGAPVDALARPRAARDRRLELHRPRASDRLRLPSDDPRRACSCSRTRCPRTSRGCAPRWWARCWMRCATTWRNGINGSGRVRVGAGLPPARGRAAARRAAPDRGAADRPASPPTWRASSRAPGRRLLRRQGRAQALLDTLRAPWSVETATEPFLHPGRSAAVLVAGERVGWLGEIHPLVARTWTWSPPRASRSTSRPWPRPPTLCPPSARRDVLPGGAPGHRRGGGRRRARQAVLSRSRATRAGPSSSASRSSTPTGADRWGRGACRSPCGWSSARPTGRSPTPRPPRTARRSSARWPSSWERRSVARVGVLGASGYTARSPRG